jgi:ParB family chromosome partitioning protein
MTVTLQDIKPASIKPNTSNPPGRTDDVAELAASITSVGILEPLIVAPNGTGATFVLLAGHRRLAAAKLAKLKTVPCLVRDDLTEPVQQLETMLVENLQRTDITPIEEAKAYQQLLEFPGYTIKRITTSTGRPAATVRKRLSLTKLSDRTQRKIQDGQITLADAVVLAEFADDPSALNRLESSIGSHNWQYALANERNRRDQAKKKARVLAELRKSGVRIIPDFKDLAALEEASKSTEFPIGWVYLGEDDFENLRQTPEVHANCEGHAAIVEHGEVNYVCTEPTKHPELLEQDDEEDADERAARKAEEAEAKRVVAELATAAEVRRAHLFEVIVDPAPSMALDILKDQVLDKCRRGFRVKEVLADVLMPKRANDEALLEQLRDRLRSLVLEQLVICLDIAENAGEEYSLEAPTGWRPDRYGSDYKAKSTQAWRNHLVHMYGYEWSQPELDIVPAPAIVDVELPAGDES